MVAEAGLRTMTDLLRRSLAVRGCYAGHLTTPVLLVFEWEIVATVAMHSPGVRVVGEVLPASLTEVEVLAAVPAVLHLVLPGVLEPDVGAKTGQLARQLRVEVVDADPIRTGRSDKATVFRTGQLHLPRLPGGAHYLLPVGEEVMGEELIGGLIVSRGSSSCAATV